jgi:hypothetical protein
MSKTVKALGDFAGGLMSFMEGLVMPVETVSATIANSGWTVFWVQLPLLVLAVAVIIVATTALRRARQEDVPRVLVDRGRDSHTKLHDRARINVRRFRRIPRGCSSPPASEAPRPPLR